MDILDRNTTHVCTFKPSLTIPVDGHEATCSCFSEDGSWLAVSHTSGIVQEGYSPCAGRVRWLQPRPCPLLVAAFDFTMGASQPARQRACARAYVGGHIHHWHATSGKLISTIQEPGNEIFSLVHQETGVLFATAGLDTKVRIYDGLTRKMSMVLDEGDGSSTSGHTNRVFALKWNSLDTNVLMSGGWDKTIQLWDLRVGKSVRSIYGPYICGASLDFDMNTKRILTGSWRAVEQLQEWDYGSGSLIRTFMWPQSMNWEKVAGSLDQLDKGVVSISFNISGTRICVVTSNQLFVVSLKE
ncbi:hypothetical protein L7F22_026110 [Adiantum nelumboides]|nr:hypothetical protein [Adiantum nelumboides]